MTGERTLGAMTPALPSRATGEAKPLTPLPTAGVDPATLPKARKATVARGRKKSRATRLSAREIKRINKNRRKNLKKAKRVKAPVAPKNPNRPLEAKNRLHAVMETVAGMAKPEVIALMNTMRFVESLAAPARKRVIEALGKVYG
jgi:hypothetical protein